MKVRIQICCFAALAGACASRPPAAPPPILAPAVDVETLLPPPAPPIVIPAHVPDYPDIRVPSNKFQGLPPGILISDATYAQCLRARQQREALRTEVGVVHQLRKDERGACEELLQSQQAALAATEEALQTARRWSTAKLVAGIALGMVVGFAGGRLGR